MDKVILPFFKDISCYSRLSVRETSLIRQKIIVRSLYQIRSMPDIPLAPSKESLGDMLEKCELRTSKTRKPYSVETPWLNNP
jgi:hypothetical protein